MSKKLVWVIILVLISILPAIVSANVAADCIINSYADYLYCSGANGGTYAPPDPQTTCNNNNGIYCDGALCAYPTVSNNFDCVVSTNQVIDTRTTIPTSYILKSLMVQSGKTLSFINSKATVGGLTNGMEPGPKDHSGDNGYAGGNGGLVQHKGQNGTGDHTPCGGANCWYSNTDPSTPGWKIGGRGGYAGTSVNFKIMYTLTVDGSISASGGNGSDGVNGEGSCNSGWVRWGKGGTGGGGGGGAGDIIITTNTLSGNGKILALGGSGGKAGNGGSKACDGGADYTCGAESDNHGGNGGNGGGGNGGSIIVRAATANSHFDTANNDTSDTVDPSAFAYFIKGGITTKDLVSGGCNWPTSDKDAVPGPAGSISTAPPVPNENFLIYDTDQLTPILTACNDGIDNDNDGLVDMADPDCYNIKTDTRFKGSCPSKNYGPPNAGYGSPQSNGATSTGVISVYQSAPNGFDGCCGDDGPGDYGFIANVTKSGGGSIFQYLCYSPTSTEGDFRSPLVDGWEWYNAIQSNRMYRIVTLNKTITLPTTPPTNKSFDLDVVSNAEEWFYCNATGDVQTRGKAIAEGSTFTNRFANDEYSCADMFSSLYSILYPNTAPYNEPFNETCVGTGKLYLQNCCELVNKPGVGLSVHTAKTITDCGHCYIHDIGVAIIPPTDNLPTSPSALPGLDEYVDKETCAADPDLCLSTQYSFNALETCDGQPNTVLCNMTSQYCNKGINLSALNDPTGFSCCFGPVASCLNRSSITTAQECRNFNGTVFSGANYYCIGGAPIPLGLNGESCCLGEVGFSFEASSFSSISNKSYKCFKENDNNILSQCCYDASCKNNLYGYSDRTSVPDGGLEVASYNKRVLTKGSALHTLENFDLLPGNDGSKNALIKDRALRKIVNHNNILTPAEFQFTARDAVAAISLENFSYLEFDVLTDSSTIELSLGGPDKYYDLGLMSDYSTNGNQTKVWHHVIIPLHTELLEGFTNIWTMQFADDTPLQRSVIMDNIVLVPETDKSISNDTRSNTKNYYCTGGFEGWVDDLDALPTDTTFQQYGPHMLACKGIASYGWTGTQCCGDDTKLVNYGEHFNDTQAGCFDGSTIKEGQRVSDVKSIRESVEPKEDRLPTFINSDLLYYNNSFVGCQIPPDKYADMKVSYNGSLDISMNKLVSHNVTLQCSVIDNSYCMNGIWRNKIADGSQNGLVAAGQNIQLKTAPAGAELIRQGFRG
jgi:hypothetical protein